MPFEDEVLRVNQEKGVSWVEMARVCDIENERFWSNYVRNPTDLGLSKAVRFAREFGVSLDRTCEIGPPTTDDVNAAYMSKDGHIEGLRDYMEWIDLYEAPQPTDKTISRFHQGSKSLLARKRKAHDAANPNRDLSRMIKVWMVATRKGRETVSDYKQAVSFGTKHSIVELNELFNFSAIKVKLRYSRMLYRCTMPDGRLAVATFCVEL